MRDDRIWVVESRLRRKYWEEGLDPWAAAWTAETDSVFVTRAAARLQAKKLTMEWTTDEFRVRSYIRELNT
jgi:hypothetical protein